MLYELTFWTNFAGFGLCLWLGFYLVTRNSRSRIAWLTALMMWAIAGMFLNILLALSPPPEPVVQASWLRIIFPFWPGHATDAQNQNSWLLGWTIGPAIVIWHHVTTLMRGPINPWRSFRISSGYLVAAAAIWLQFSTPWLYTNESGNPLYINALRAGVLFPIFGAFILLFSGWCLVNLYRSMIAAPSEILRRQFVFLTLATFIAGLTAPLSLAGTYLEIALPIVGMTVPMAIGIVLAGYGIARYSALMEGRTMQRDIVQFALGSGVMAAAYIAVMAVVSSTYMLPRISYVAAVFLAVTSYALIGAVDSLLERLLYKESARAFKASLRRLNRLAESPEQLDAQLQEALETLSSAVGARYGVLYAFQDGAAVERACCGWERRDPGQQASRFEADDVVHLRPGDLPEPHQDAALLIPLYVDTGQIGVILLGRPENSLQFSGEDVELLLDPADLMADALERGNQSVQQLAQLHRIAAQPSLHSAPQATSKVKFSTRHVETALRNLNDYAYLGDSPLAELKLVRRYREEGDGHTHVDLGKAVVRMLGDVVDKLHPDSERPTEPVPREWYPYLILYDAYFMDVPNRDIMSRLYVSEGTFNRTRRAALRAVTRVLQEMELSA